MFSLMAVIFITTVGYSVYLIRKIKKVAKGEKAQGKPKEITPIKSTTVDSE